MYFYQHESFRADIFCAFAFNSFDYWQAMKSVTDRQTKEAHAKLIKEKELSKVKISKDDVDLIVSIRRVNDVHSVEHF